MTNLGTSKGCSTCKQRRVKCDEGKPKCQRCKRLGRDCGGYQKPAPRLKFVNSLFEQYARVYGFSSPSTTEPSPAAHKKDIALSFFLTHFADMGRSVKSSRGFWELMPVMLSSERHDSAVSLAISAVSTAMLDRWLELGDGPSRQSFIDAIARLQTAVDDPIESRKGSTILAALILQFQDSLAAISGLKNIKYTHYEGAVALRRHQGLGLGDNAYGTLLTFYLLHTEVLFALGTRGRLSKIDLPWLQYDAKSLNPSSRLDLIAIDIANLQHHFANICPSGCTGEEELLKVSTKAAAIDVKLKAWSSGIPAHWRPVEFDHVPICNPSIITYSGPFDVYPSVQIASVWNTWRYYRLINLRMLFRGLEIRAKNSKISTENISSVRQSIQHLLDHICKSIPFLLGNRVKLGNLHDFKDPNNFLPSYHSLKSKKKLAELQKTSDFMSMDEHFKHVIAQGPWHSLIPLTQVLGFFSRNQGGSFTALLERGRHKWMEEQVLRSRILMGLRPATASLS